MSTLELHKLVGRAVINRKFQTGLLNGHRAELLGQFKLEPEEVAAVMAIEAADVTEFAIAVEHIVNTREAALRRNAAGREGKWRGHEGRLGLPWTASSVHL